MWECGSVSGGVWVEEEDRVRRWYRIGKSKGGRDRRRRIVRESGCQAQSTCQRLCECLTPTARLTPTACLTPTDCVSDTN